MSTTNELSETTRHLPLTKPTRSDAPGVCIDEAMIRSLVDTFYDAVRDDDLLGPIFARHVAVWSLHLPKMYDFWSTVVLRTGRYAGRPIEAHRRLHGLTQTHFDRWLSLWSQTVARVVPRAGQDAFVIPAQRMASSMSAALFRGGAIG
jgi:hemoglobin